jgi:F420-0:gamma-glutamyl ligase-like protein
MIIFWTWTVSKSQIVWYNILYMYRYVPIIICALYTYIYLYFIYIYILCVILDLKEEWGKNNRHSDWNL